MERDDECASRVNRHSTMRSVPHSWAWWPRPREPTKPERQGMMMMMTCRAVDCSLPIILNDIVFEMILCYALSSNCICLMEITPSFVLSIR